MLSHLSTSLSLAPLASETVYLLAGGSTLVSLSALLTYSRTPLPGKPADVLTRQFGSGEWTDTMNNNLMHKIGSDQNGNLSERNFVKYFEETLPTDETAFDKTVKQFLDCATSLRKKKIEKRAVARKPAPSVVDDVPKSPGSPRQVGAGLLRLITSLALRLHSVLSCCWHC